MVAYTSGSEGGLQSVVTSWVVSAVGSLARKPPNMYTLVAAAISVGSFYTTFAGFNMFFGGWSAFAFPVAFVVQLFVFHFSMEFGRFVNGDAESVVQVVATFLLLPITFIVSFGFSAVFFWDGVFTGDQQRRAFTTNVQSEVAAEIERMADDRDAAGDATISSIREEVVRWEESVFAELGRIASDNQANVGSIIRQQIAEKQDALAKEESERQRLIGLRTGALEAVQTNQFRINELSAESETLQTAIQENSDARAQELVKKTNFENEAQAELDGTGNRQAGDGPKYDAAIANAKKAQEEADRLSAIILQQQRDLVANQSQITQLELAAGPGTTNVDDSEIQQFDTRIGGLQRAIRDLQVELRLEQSQGDGGNSGFITLLRNQPTIEAYAAALGRCEASLEFYRDQGGDGAQKANAISCAQPRLERAIQSFVAFQNGEAEFLARCGLQADEFRAIDTLDKVQTLAYGRECLNLAQLSITTAQDYRTSFGNLDREQDAGAFLFTRASEAWQKQESTLISSVAVAFGIDLLIFVAGYLATQKQHQNETKNLRRGELSDVLHRIWQVDLDPKPDDPKGILLAKLVIAQLNPIAEEGIYVREMNLTQFKDELFQAEQQGIMRGLVAGFNVGFSEWIRKFGSIELRTVVGTSEPQEFLKVREEFINYFAKKVYDYENCEPEMVSPRTRPMSYPPNGNGARRLASARPEDAPSRFLPLDDDDDEDEDGDVGDFSAGKFSGRKS